LVINRYILTIILVIWHPIAPILHVQEMDRDSRDVQQIEDISMLQMCVQADGADSRHCVGYLAHKCEKESSETQRALAAMECYGREAQAWESLVTQRFQMLLSWAEQQDRQVATDNDRNAAATLRAAQEAWLAYHKAELDRFQAIRAGAASHWRAADLERRKSELLASRLFDLSLNQ
jgi:uncharacterized protein YecT (DUF1311 family)